jgi:hypothetical protein
MINHFIRVPPVFLDAFEIEQVSAHFRGVLSRLLARIDFLEAPSMREQVHIACEELHGPDDIRVPLKAIAVCLCFLAIAYSIISMVRSRPKQSDARNAFDQKHTK